MLWLAGLDGSVQAATARASSLGFHCPTPPVRTTLLAVGLAS
jgi:hypothetical protein